MSLTHPVAVVGYDGSPPSESALEYALDRLGSGALSILHAWEPSGALRGSQVYPVLEAEIVVGSHGHGRLRSALGSTAHGVLHHAPCAVTVVPRRAAQRVAT